MHRLQNGERRVRATVSGVAPGVGQESDHSKSLIGIQSLEAFQQGHAVSHVTSRTSAGAVWSSALKLIVLIQPWPGQILDRLDGGDEGVLRQLAATCGCAPEALDQDVAELAGDQDVAELTRLLGRVAVDRLAAERLVVGDAGLGRRG